MNRVKFFGEAYTHDSELVRSVLAKWSSATDLEVRVKIFGDRVTYEDDVTYVFAEIGTGPGQQDCLLQGHLLTSLDDAKKRLQSLVDMSKARGVEAYVDFTEVNDTGDDVSNEFRVK